MRFTLSFSFAVLFADELFMSGPDYILDIKGLSPNSNSSEAMTNGASSMHESAPHESGSRPWLAVNWKCCSAYSRVYRNRSGTAYEGYCPKCGKALRVKIGENGTSHRFFEAF